MKNPARTDINLRVLAVLIAANCSACVILSRSTLPSTTLSKLEESTPVDVEPTQLVEQALAIAATAEDPDALFSRLAIQLAEAGQYEQALRIAETLEVGSRDDSLALIALMLAEAGQYEQALVIIDTIEEALIKSSSLAQIGLSLAETEQLEASADAFKTALQEVEAIVFNNENEPIPSYKRLRLVTMAEQATTAGQPELALQLLEIAIGLSDAVVSDLSSADETVAIATQFIALEDVDRALQIAQSMAPSVQQVAILTKAAVAMASTGQNERADQVLTEAMNVGQSLSDGYLSNGSCYIEKSDALRLVVEAMATVQQIQTATAVAADIQDCALVSDGYDNAQGDAYVEIIQNAPSIDEVNRVLDTLPGETDALAASQPLSEGEAMTHNRVLMAIAIKLAEWGETEQAVEIANTVQPTSVRGFEWTPREALLELITALTNQDALEPALQMIERLQSFEPLFVHAGTIGEELTAVLEIGIALEASGQVEQADKVFKVVMEQALTLDEVLESEPDNLKGQADLLITLSEQFRQANRPKAADELLDHAFEEARLIAQRLRQDYLPEDVAAVDEVASVLQISNTLQQQGRAQQSQDLLDEAFALTQAFFAQDTFPSGETADTHQQRFVLLARLTATTEFATSHPAIAAQLTEVLVPQLQNALYTSDTSIEKAAYDLMVMLADAGQTQAALALAEIPFAPETQTQMLMTVAASQW